MDTLDMPRGSGYARPVQPAVPAYWLARARPMTGSAASSSNNRPPSQAPSADAPSAASGSGSQRGLTPEVADYIDSPGIAHRYDRDHHEFPLFDLDLQIVRELTAELPPRPDPAADADDADDEPRVALDLGCGTGRLLQPLAELGFRVVGVDLSSHMLGLAREKLAAAELEPADVRLFRADITDLYFLDNSSVDLAVCLYSTFGLISGRENRLACLRGIRRVLKPGGKLLLHVHNRYHGLPGLHHLAWLWQSWRAARRGMGEFGDCYFDDYLGLIRRMYIHAFGPRELRRLLTEAGFASADVLCINRRRDGLLRPGWTRWMHANGFFAVATRPPR